MFYKVKNFKSILTICLKSDKISLREIMSFIDNLNEKDFYDCIYVFSHKNIVNKLNNVQEIHQ